MKNCNKTDEEAVFERFEDDGVTLRDQNIDILDSACRLDFITLEPLAVLESWNDRIMNYSLTLSDSLQMHNNQKIVDYVSKRSA